MCNQSTTGTDSAAPERLDWMESGRGGPDWCGDVPPVRNRDGFRAPEPDGYGDVPPEHNRDGFLGAEEDLTAEWPGRGPDHVGSVP
jgi:hypothetical protein